jgi:ABC-type antimicrobial peptide transport system permease subunit
VLVAFAALALVLAATGVFGVMAQTVGERTREIGIRLALGATTNAVWRMVVRDGMALPMIGVVCGLALSLGVGQALRGLLYGVRATEPAVLLGAAGFLLLLALAGTMLPARRATRVDPRIALRSE